MSSIYCYWFKFPDNIHNAGDELGPYIIEKLSGQKVKYIYVNDVTYKNFVKRFLRIIRRMFQEDNFKLAEIKTFFISLFIAKNYIISAGSIIQYAATEKSIVWGSGINYPQRKIKNSTFKAVRGPLTLNLLKDCGISTKGIVLGDPALLLPLIYVPKAERKFQLGIIAHLAHEKYVEEHCTNNTIKIISMSNGNIEEVINEINLCSATISSSLHGIIISHAYKIPCIWFEFPGYIGGEGNIKFKDYFLSVGIEPYNGYRVEADVLNKPSEILKIITSESKKSLPIIELKKLQEDLIDVAPFKILDKYLV